VPKINIGGIGIAYELIGDGKRTALITPGVVDSLQSILRGAADVQSDRDR